MTTLYYNTINPNLFVGLSEFNIVIQYDGLQQSIEYEYWHELYSVLKKFIKLDTPFDCFLMEMYNGTFYHLMINKTIPTELESTGDVHIAIDDIDINIPAFFVSELALLYCFMIRIHYHQLLTDYPPLPNRLEKI